MTREKPSSPTLSTGRTRPSRRDLKGSSLVGKLADVTVFRRIVMTCREDIPGRTSSLRSSADGVAYRNSHGKLVHRLFARGLLTLTALEIVLGIDNIVFILDPGRGDFPKTRGGKARVIGLAWAMISPDRPAPLPDLDHAAHRPFIDIFNRTFSWAGRHSARAAAVPPGEKHPRESTTASKSPRTAGSQKALRTFLGVALQIMVLDTTSFHWIPSSPPSPGPPRGDHGRRPSSSPSSS